MTRVTQYGPCVPAWSLRFKPHGLGDAAGTQRGVVARLGKLVFPRGMYTEHQKWLVGLALVPRHSDCGLFEIDPREESIKFLGARYTDNRRIATCSACGLKALALLEQTNMPVTLIGLRCGFEQPSYFPTSFRAKTGFSPRAWRQSRRS